MGNILHVLKKKHISNTKFNHYARYIKVVILCDIFVSLWHLILYIDDIRQ